jgi:DNA polymerase elongation subunit (family B)
MSSLHDLPASLRPVFETATFPLHAYLLDIVPFDDDENNAMCACFCTLRPGQSTVVYVKYEPWVYISVPSNWSRLKIQQLFGTVSSAIVRVCFERRHFFYGYQGSTPPTLFAKVFFATFKQMRTFLYKFKNSRDNALRQFKRSQTFPTVRKNDFKIDMVVGPDLMFQIDKNIKMSSWITVLAGTVVTDDPSTTATFAIRDGAIGPCEEPETSLPPLVVLSYDIETYSEDGVSFSDASNSADKVIQIGMVFQAYPGTNDDALKIVVCVGEPAPSTDSNTFYVGCQSEPLLFALFATLVRKYDPDVLIGYNTFNFDNNYIYDRQRLHHDRDHFSNQSRLTQVPCEWVIKELNSAAKGQNKFCYLSWPGRVTIDVWKEIKENETLPNYKLTTVSEKYLNDRKIDLNARDMFALAKKGDPASLKTIADYCAKDCVLPLRLIFKLNTLENASEMSAVSNTPMKDIFLRGQQVKIWNKLLRKALSEGYIVDSKFNPRPSEYEGASVLAPIAGYHPLICTLDFKSLYPSIMIAHNLCYTTYVYDERNVPADRGAYNTYLVNGKNNHFLKSERKKGILPDLLTDLLNARAQAKRDMKRATDPFVKKVMNGRQLALKIMCNSVYGFTGVVQGYLPCFQISTTTTCIGRSMIQASSTLARQSHAVVVYGDSVAGNTPLLLRIRGEIRVETIETLSSAEVLNKEVYTYTEKGWTLVKQVIRHRLAEHKRMLRVCTHTGIVDVTSDHSLINEDGVPIFPEDIIVGTTKLLQCYPGSNLSPPALEENEEVFVEGQLHAARAYYKMRTLGHQVDVRWKNGELYGLRARKNKSKGSNVVKKIIPLPHQEYVYDLTTENEHFQAGIGNTIVHNTDSIMIKWEDIPATFDGMRMCYDRGTALGGEISRYFDNETKTKGVIVLEFEKCCFPFLIFEEKKRYISNYYEHPDDEPKLDAKGVQMKRRDGTPLLVQLYRDIVGVIFPATRVLPKNPSELKGAILACIERTLQTVVTNELPLSMYTIRKTLRSNYKNNNIPHVRLADKIRERIRNGELCREMPQSGKGVEMVVIQKSGAQLFDRAEDPEWFVQHKNLKLDMTWYLQNMEKPIHKLISFIFQRDDRVKKLFERYKGEAYRVSHGLKKLDNFFAKTTTKPDKRKRAKRKPSGRGVQKKQQGINSYFTKKT